MPQVRGARVCSRPQTGWGMRIAFVPEDYVTDNPKVEIGDPKKD
jgi:hypothetical protein